jgi:hypothetical protein
MTEQKPDSIHDIYFTPELKKKYAYYKMLAGDLDKRDWAFQKMREIVIHEAHYDFNPEKHSIDAKIPKGGILDAIRDSCK